MYIETKYNIEISTDIKLLYTSAMFTNVHTAKFLSVSVWNDTIRYATIRYDTRCYFNVRSKAVMNQLNLPLGTDN